MTTNPIVFQILRDFTGEKSKIAKIIKSSKVYIGSDVTESRVKYLSNSGELKDYSIIHFATHAKSYPDIPELSAIILTADEDGSQVNFNPSYDSKNITKDDGFLRVDEIRDLEISADMVCLSACETGVGKLYFTEGVVNFSQAFMEAGANSVTITLWPIFPFLLSSDQKNHDQLIIF